MFCLTSSIFLPALRQLAEAGAVVPYRYKPFLTPLPLWDDNKWPWLLLPLCIAIAVTYKSIKCREMKQVPKEAALLTVWIVVGMAMAALGLGLLVEAMERFNR